ncbi:septum formation protein [Epilithonimonas bovis DSM 19482]|uniref:dTTP/UTP pyrophosphatase n=1 Tax=Epilithonimonas bovis DSM 19482 TaxID=1121284 RepID=A0A1U7PR64_9FLAO|nr:Maf family nucleotide pyrophosphatase [Epilithonimonas bovis]SIT95399.1 septum formation protein [Epilithonimonas bovis DSM 19482]HBR11466.1 septum formation protein Maf [Chryseobacterium sp.]
MKLLLASNSPRRKELLSQLGYDFEVVKIDVDESYPEDLKPNQISEYVSAKKAAALEVRPGEVLLTSDTIVALDQQILLKPKSEQEAFAMLKKLSAKTHQVYTAFTIKTDTSQLSRTSKTDVEFSEINDDEINFYINNYKPFDKAGSYGIQEWLGMAKIKNITGSFYAVMGLPADLVYEELKKLGCFPANFQNRKP